ncbi:MAG TPA: FRG domain-containing protein [Longimicrobium sp.]|jgi:hypothetical protein
MFPNHLYRGHAGAGWRLESSLERSAVRWNHPFDALRQAESMMMREFQRQAHHYMADLPEVDCYIDWLAIMQHYGTPTRLLDFTLSYYVAAFFAMEGAESDSAIWAINQEVLQAAVANQYSIEQQSDYLSNNALRLDTAGKTFRDQCPAPGVIHFEPFKQHQRLIVQQGLFVLPVAAHISFEANLLAGLGLHSGTLDNPTTFAFDGKAPLPVDVIGTPIVKVVLDGRMRSEALKDLSRMNITAATLFPGLDGFSRSLTSVLRVFDALRASMRP